jgi:hypothetical protein
VTCEREPEPGNSRKYVFAYSAELMGDATLGYGTIFGEGTEITAEDHLLQSCCDPACKLARPKQYDWLTTKCGASTVQTSSLPPKNICFFTSNHSSY